MTKDRTLALPDAEMARRLREVAQAIEAASTLAFDLRKDAQPSVPWVLEFADEYYEDARQLYIHAELYE